MKKNYFADFMLILVTMIWGVTFIIIKDAVSVIPAPSFLMFRFSIASLVFIIFFGRTILHTDRNTIYLAFIVSIFTYLGYVLQTIGLQYTTASKSGFITGFNVVLTPIFEALIMKTKPQTSSVISIAPAMAGLYLLTTGINLSFNIGDFLTILCAISLAIQVVLISKYGARVNTFQFAIYQVLFVTAFAVATAFIIDKPQIPSSPKIIAELVMTGVVATALTFILQNRYQAMTSPTHASVIYICEPAFSAFFAWLILGEAMGFRGLIGGILIILGMFISELPMARPFKKQDYKPQTPGT
ncbi:DMT family transporter [Calorimonas adulescens]|uniref:DMT family transporter n=1 Tax=Calorimonas adulescens TaxID=2606906 RepID=A0A5D8QB33_9THEO|nr:DMT family transporter [Calorimonas adulescens]TZE81721.1 DMT family transporter [Calorimonas adulescens]